MGVLVGSTTLTHIHSGVFARCDFLITLAFSFTQMRGVASASFSRDATVTDGRERDHYEQ